MKFLLLTIFIATFLFTPNPKFVSAQQNAPSEEDFESWIDTATPDFSSHSTIGQLITDLLPYVFYGAGFLLLIYIVIGGFQILISSGDPKQMAAGREKITYAIVGFIIMFSAYFIMQLVAEILDLDQIRWLF